MSIYKKLNSEDSYFLNLLILDFELNKSAIAMKKSREKLSYKQLYKKLKDNEKVIIELQEKLADKKASDIKDFFSHSKNDLVLAHHFVNTLYAQDPTRKMNAMFMKKAKRFKDWYDEKFKMEKVR